MVISVLYASKEINLVSSSKKPRVNVLPLRIPVAESACRNTHSLEDCVFRTYFATDDHLYKVTPSRISQIAHMREPRRAGPSRVTAGFQF